MRKRDDSQAWLILVIIFVIGFVIKPKNIMALACLCFLLITVTPSHLHYNTWCDNFLSHILNRINDDWYEEKCI